MPVTAKLSRNFYEQFGEQVADELVDWFNSVDAEFQSRFDRSNELNWERFKSELNAVEAKLRGEMAAMEARLRIEIAGVRSDMIKWMFIFWTGTVVPLAGLIIALHSH